MPLLQRKRVVLVKQEATYGIDSVPVAANAILVSDLSITPQEAGLVDRNLIQPFMGSSDQLPSTIQVKIGMTVELQSSGSLGVAPGVGPLLRACGFAEIITAVTKVEYMPVSAAFDSAVIYYNVDGVLHKATGCRGTVAFDFNVAGIPTAKFSFTGIYQPVIDAVAVVPSYIKFKTPFVAGDVNSTFTLHGYAGALESLSIDMANDVTFRSLMGASADSVLITDRKPSGSVVMESTTVAQKDWFATVRAVTTGALAVSHGVGAGFIVKIDCPKVQINSPTYSEKDGISMTNLALAIKPNLGNDEIKITFV